MPADAHFAPLAEGDVAAQLDQRCAELESAYPRTRLEALVANGGVETGDDDQLDTPGTADDTEQDTP